MKEIYTYEDLENLIKKLTDHNPIIKTSFKITVGDGKIALVELLLMKKPIRGYVYGFPGLRLYVKTKKELYEKIAEELKDYGFKNKNKEVESLKVKDLKTLQKEVNNFFSKKGGAWSDERRFCQVIEELGEISREIHNDNRKGILDELGDVGFSYIGYIEALKENYENKEQTIRGPLEIITYFLWEFWLENKRFRKKENTENKQRVKKCIYYLRELASYYNTTLEGCIINTLYKYNNRK